MPGVWRILAVLALTLPAATHAAEIDLAGTWKLRLVACLPGETVCAAKLKALPQDQPLATNLPANLHSTFSWFYGEAHFSRTFEYEPQKNEPGPDMLLLGSIGSVDQTYVNGVLIGHEGLYEADAIVSTWNKLRTYRLPATVLKPGTNTIEVHAKVLDIKAGIHAGPLKMGHARQILIQTYPLQFVREHIFTASPIISLILIFAFFITAKYWRDAEGRGFLIGATCAYLVHSLYFTPIPIVTEYLIFLKLQWSGRIFSMTLITLYFLSNFGVLRNRDTAIWLAISAAAIVPVWFSGEIYFFGRAVFWEILLFLGHLIYPAIYLKVMRDSVRREVYIRYFIMAIPVGTLYVCDGLMAGGFTNLPWLYHYMGIFNVVNFLDHHSFHLFTWRDKGRELGKAEATVQHLKETMQMANELHDVVGAELSHIVSLSSAKVGTDQQTLLNRLASNSLEKIRNFAHILKGEAEADEVSALLQKLVDRLAALGRYQVFYHRPPADCSAIVLSRDARHHLERILSEWSSNVIRHAKQATTLHVSLRCNHKNVNVFFFQDKPGFTWRGKSDVGGLASIAHRAAAMGAKIQCRTFGSGALLIIAIPLETQHA